MDPDSDSPLTRLERTFWTVWYYISGAVNRFLRPEATNNISSDPNSSQASAVNCGPTDSGNTDNDASGGGVKEEEPLAPASLHGSSGAVVVWDITLEPVEEHTQCKTQLSEEEDESMRDEQLNQAGDDDAGHTQAEGEEEENIDLIFTHKQVESPENEEHAKMESLNLTDGTMSEDIIRSRRKDGAEEETRTTMTLITHPDKMDETTTDLKVKEDDNKTHNEDKQKLEEKDSEIKSNTITYHDVKEEDGMHTEEVSMQRDAANAVVMGEEEEEEEETCAGVLQVTSENENKSDDGEEDESHVSVCEQSLEHDIDVHRDTDGEEVMAHRSEGDKVEDVEGEEDESMGEEQLDQAGNDDAGHTQAEGEEEEDIDQIFTYKQVESPEDEEHAKMESLNLTDGTMSEDIIRSRTKDGAEEETRTTMTLKTHPADLKVKEDDNKTHDEDKQKLEEKDSEIKSNTITYHDAKEEDGMHTEEVSMQRDAANTVVMSEEEEEEEEEETCAGVLQVTSENENKSDDGEEDESHVSVCEQSLEHDIDVHRDTDGKEVMAHRSEGDKVEDVEGEDDKSILHESEQYEEESLNESADNQTTDEEKEQKEDSPEKDILSEHVTCSNKATLNAKTDLHTAEFTDEEQEDVAKKTQTKTREIDDAGAVVDEKCYVTTADVVVNEIFFENDQVEEERAPSEENDQKSHVEIECTVNSPTVKPEAETGQEVSRELNNFPLRMCEGQVVASPELNTPTCEETKEGVPAHNNEPQPDENTTQWFLEVGDCKEIQTTQLPEEVESQKPETLQNSDSSSGAGSLLVKENKEQEQESTEHAEVLHPTDTELPQDTDKPLVVQVKQESGLLFEKEKGTLLVDLMKTGIELAEKEFEDYVGLADEPDETTELQDENEELLVDFETDEGPKGAAGGVPETTGAVAAGEVLGFTETPKLLDTEAPKMMDTRILQQESSGFVNSDQNCNMMTSLPGDITESGFLEESDETEPEIVGDCTVEVQDSGMHVEVTGYELAEDERQNKSQMEMLNLQLVEMLTAGSESKEAFEISSNEVLTDTEAADGLMTAEFKAKDLTVMSTEDMAKAVTELQVCFGEDTNSSDSGHQEVIDEEILDLWIQTVSSEDADQMKQEGSEPGQQIDINTEQSNEEPAGVSSKQAEMEKGQLVESNSEESELVHEMEISSSESGFLEQSLTTVWQTQTSESKPLKSTCTESLQNTNDVFTPLSESADISEFSKSESQDILTEEAAQSDLKEEGSVKDTELSADSGVTGEQVEYLEKETASQKDTDADIADLEMKIEWEDSEEVDANSLTSAEKVEKSKAEVVSLEITTSDSPAEIAHSESGRPRSGPGFVLEERITSEATQTGSQVHPWTEPEKLFKLPSLETAWSSSEVTAEALSEPNGAEVLEYPTANSEELLEVDSSSLDFTAQRSRIALKNPRVRPPKDPRFLLNMPSLEPTPSSHLPVRVPAGLPLGGLGVGIKLPGLGAGFPVLKKTQRVVREENSPETAREPETKPEDKGDLPQQDEAPQKPKWMPPKHPGFGNPLMSELKSKLKKTPQE